MAEHDNHDSGLMTVAEELAELLLEQKGSMSDDGFKKLLADCNDLIKRESGVDFGATCSSNHGGRC